MTPPLRLAHYVSLSGFGGVEQQFAAFVARAATRPGVRQTAVACSPTIHSHHAAAQTALDELVFEKRWRGIRLPRHPGFLRRRWALGTARRQRADVALLWNRLGQQQRAIDALGVRRALYWEHGSAWLYGEDAAKQAVLEALPAVLANSYAAQRLLQLRWRYQGHVRVIPNGVRAPLADRPRNRDMERPIRLGFAGRLVPVKGAVLALHALAALIAEGRDATLAIAGDGPLRARLVEQASTLGVANRVRFLGVVADMSAFFAGIDLLLHPPLREPFGLVAAEAQAAGVPVICAAVDGLPEVVAHGRTGLCVPPAAELARHAALGGENAGLPPVVYQPNTDCIAEPRLCEPAALAAAVARLADDAAGYRAMSAAAIEHMRQRFDFDTHIDRVLAAAHEYAKTGTLAAS